VRVYRFIDSQRTDFDVKTLCRVCEVSRSSYYDWAAAQSAGRDGTTVEEAYLANRIYDIWKGARGRYGVPRVTAQLWREGSGSITSGWPASCAWSASRASADAERSSPPGAIRRPHRLLTW
jgi:hypothetical protein